MVLLSEIYNQPAVTSKSKRAIAGTEKQTTEKMQYETDKCLLYENLEQTSQCGHMQENGSKV